MGYLYNHLATVVCGAFAAVLTALWPLLTDPYPVLDFVFVMAVPITWFLVLMCWLAQKSTDYAHSHAPPAAPGGAGAAPAPAGALPAGAAAPQKKT